MEKKTILVFVEQYNKNISEVGLELISEATRLAPKIDAEVTAVVIGHDMKNKLSTLAHYGAEKVYYVNNKEMEHFTSVPYSKTVSDIIKKYKPEIVLFGATTQGRDMAPRVASNLKCGLTADCTELKIGDYKFRDKEYQNILLQMRPAFGGNIIATIVSPESSPSMASVREGVMKLNTPNEKLKAQIIEEKVQLSESDLITKIIKITNQESNVNLKEAKIIVGAGMGAADTESLAKIKELAEILGAELGATRAIVDSGLLDHERQVGQTGVTVRPNLYIACGISGQIQHRAGMSGAKRIVAINSDPAAPIFSVAHYGIVGDIKDVIPKMIKAYKTRK